MAKADPPRKRKIFEELGFILYTIGLLIGLVGFVMYLTRGISETSISVKLCAVGGIIFLMGNILGVVSQIFRAK